MSYWNGRHWVTERSETTTAPRPSRRLLGASLEASLIVLLTFGLIAGTTLAAKGGGHGGGGKPASGTGTVAMVTMDGATEAHFGARVTFEVSTTATPYPYVHLMCYQGGVLVGE